MTRLVHFILTRRLRDIPFELAQQQDLRLTVNPALNPSLRSRWPITEYAMSYATGGEQNDQPTTHR